MKLNTIPTRIKAQSMEHSIFTGKKYCFVYVDMHRDFSWDGEKQIVDFVDKGVSVLFSEKELKAFRESDTVHNFLLELKAEQINELKKLSKKGQRKTYKCKNGKIYDLAKQRKERIEFLTDNDIRFVEIQFTKDCQSRIGTGCNESIN